MPVFDNTVFTPEQHAFMVMQEGKVSSNSNIANVARVYKEMFDAFWHNDKFTPQQACDAWGTEALTMFMKSSATRDFLLAMDVECLPEEYRTTPLPVNPEIVDGAPTGRMIVG